MLATKLQSTPVKVCLICGTNILLDHPVMDGRGLCVHASCHEKQMLLNAAAQQIGLWRQSLVTRKSA